jgi:sulfhydrogenase subunit beta (sulfur reductase)
MLRAEAMMAPPVSLEGLDRMLPELFNDPVWTGIAASCVNCGACAFSCPTCHCFDMQDEGRNGRGRRLRVWDSCMFSGFTLEASGHNPRSLSLQRVRQRVMHKFSYFPLNYGEKLCAGCGRCVTVCPVGFDIRKVLRGLGAPRE